MPQNQAQIDEHNRRAIIINALARIRRGCSDVVRQELLDLIALAETAENPSALWGKLNRLVRS